MFACRIRSQKYPKEDETVITKTVSLENDVVTMELLEYNNIPGLVLNSELSKKRVRSIHQITKIGNTEICQVMHIDEAKGYIDLSLKKVSEEDHAACMKSYLKNCAAYQIMAKLSRTVGKDIQTLYELFGYAAADESGGLYLYFYRAKDRPEILQNNPYRDEILKIVEEHFKVSEVKVRVDVDVSTRSKGVDFIREALGRALKIDDTLEITLLKSPTYSIVKVSEDRETALAVVSQAADAVRRFVEESGDYFAITKPVSVYGDKNKHEDEEKMVEESEDSN